ncbi:MAG: peptidase M50, partial [Methylacidiphilaceae bacterium]|nr:peptidase M50 [Candidatus Methylacidiphilaceae bacterium]
MPPLRTDLLWHKQEFGSEEYYVLKDPIGLAYFRLRPEEAELAALFDGRRSAGEIARLHNEAWPNWSMDAEEVWEFAAELGRRGMVHLPAAQAVASAVRRAPNLFELWARFVHHLIFFKVPLVDPSPWIDRLIRPVWWAWSPPVVALTVCFWVGTGLFLLLHREAFAAAELNFLSPESFGLLALSLGILKT